MEEKKNVRMKQEKKKKIRLAGKRKGRHVCSFPVTIR
jgi:hypothetical protein